jgi:phage tail tape-measure protein
VAFYSNDAKVVEAGTKGVLPGGAQGALAGASLGASIGTVVPGIGNLIGAGIGAIAGFAVGSVKGKIDAEKAETAAQKAAYEQKRQTILQRADLTRLAKNQQGAIDLGSTERALASYAPASGSTYDTWKSSAFGSR